MKQYIIYGGIIVLVFAVLIYQAVKSSRDRKKRLLERIRRQYGAYSNKEYEYDDFLSIAHYFVKKNKSRKDIFTIDDITWNDLDMDHVFLAMNNTQSSVGQDYLYDMLRRPCFDQAELDRRDRLAKYFAANPEVREQCQMLLAGVGYTRKVSIMDFIDEIAAQKRGSNLPHYMCILLVIASIVLIAVQPDFGVILLIGTLVYNVATYLSSKGKVETYFMCIAAIVRLIGCSEELQKVGDGELTEYTARLKESAKTVRSVKQDAVLIGSPDKVDGGLAQAILDYVRMIFHVDLICYNNALQKIQPHMPEVMTMWETIGQLEAGIAIASFREAVPFSCKPEFITQNSMQMKNGYHPLITKPVANTIEEYRPVLITGSNASGKSTFLKMTAINAILAQTINIVLAQEYRAPMYRIYSSMALSDNLSAKESYYMVEIKSLKRILDAAKDTNTKVLCFVDEVLRGTNTVERIAASAKVLQKLAAEQVMCFAATHDIELTQLLEKAFANYHFTEEIVEDDIKFSYRIHKGRATSRNAIRLLGIMGYDEQVIKEAEETARNFLETGEWKMEM